MSEKRVFSVLRHDEWAIVYSRRTTDTADESPDSTSTVAARCPDFFCLRCVYLVKRLIVTPGHDHTAYSR